MNGAAANACSRPPRSRAVDHAVAGDGVTPPPSGDRPAAAAKESIFRFRTRTRRRSGCAARSRASMHPRIAGWVAGAPLAALRRADPAVLEGARGQAAGIRRRRRAARGPGPHRRGAGSQRMLGAPPRLARGVGAGPGALRAGPASATSSPIRTTRRFSTASPTGSSKVLFAMVDQVLEARRAAGSNLNHQLALESLLIRWAAMTPEIEPTPQ